MNRLRGSHRQRVGAHDAPLVQLRVGLGGAQAGFISSVYSIISPIRSSVCGSWALPSVWVISNATPSTNSHLARFLAAP